MYLILFIVNANAFINVCKVTIALSPVDYTYTGCDYTLASSSRLRAQVTSLLLHVLNY